MAGVNEVKLGKDFSTIPERIVPYKGELKNCLMIRSSRGKKLIYYSPSPHILLDGEYRIMTNDPSSFLTWDDINDEWKEEDWFTDFIITNKINLIGG